MALNRLYEDFLPAHDWARDERSDTLIIPLEGFSRSQLKVQITSTRKIRVSGERQVEGNMWRRFHKEFPVPQDSDTNAIGAKFEQGILYVRFPKLITPAVKPPQPAPPPTQQAPPPPPPPPPPPTPTPPPQPATREQLKAEEETKKDETKMEQKEKEPPKEYKKKEDISEGKEVKEKAKAKPREDRKKQEEESRMASFTEGLSSMQGQDYKEAIVGLVGELKKQKNVINRLVVVFVVLLLGLYLKRLVVSFFGGSSNKGQQEL